MAKRGGAVHVATTRRKYKDTVYETHLLRRTFRKGGKVQHETVGNLSHLPGEVVDMIRRSLKGEAFVSLEDSFECVRSLPHGHVMAALGTLRRLGLDRVLAAKRSRERDLVVAMVVSRIIDARSKLATAQATDEGTATTTAGDVLDLGKLDEDELYAAMDWLLPRQAKIEDELAKRHLEDHTLILYDVTSSYFEGRTCPLAKLGYNRDKKKGKLQIVIGLLCNKEGCPISVEVFEGNTGDPTTVGPQVRKIRERFKVSHVVLVGDRGMLTDARIREDVKPVEDLHFISSLRSPAIKKLVEKGHVSRSLFDERDLAEITSEEYPGERLIVCRNPLLEAERRRKREELLLATEAAFDEIVAAIKRKKNPLRGAAAIGQKVGKVKNSRKMGKHFILEITSRSFKYRRNEEKINEEAALDGIYIVRTDVTEDVLDAAETVAAYKSLSNVEQAFRTMKTIDLKVRPIHHRLPRRVKAHVFLCMLAYYVEWHMRRDLAQILLSDHDKESATRDSVVAPAKRSAAGQQKVSSRRTEDDLPAQSFRSLMNHLGTIVKNWVRPRGTTAPPFTMVTKPNDLQQRAFDLLRLPIPK